MPRLCPRRCGFENVAKWRNGPIKLTLRLADDLPRHAGHGRSPVVVCMISSCSPSAVRPKRSAGGLGSALRVKPAADLRSLLVVNKVVVRWPNGLRLEDKQTVIGSQQGAVNW